MIRKATNGGRTPRPPYPVVLYFSFHLAACSGAHSSEGDAAVEDEAVVCPPAPYIDGECDLNVGEFSPQHSSGVVGADIWYPQDTWNVGGVLGSRGCGSEMFFTTKTYSTDAPSSSGIYRIEDWVDGRNCELCVRFEDVVYEPYATKTYQAVSGNLLISEIETEYGGSLVDPPHFNGRLTDVVLWQLDPITWEFLDGGEVLCIATWEVDVQLGPDI